MYLVLDNLDLTVIHRQIYVLVANRYNLKLFFTIPEMLNLNKFMRHSISMRLVRQLARGDTTKWLY